MKIGIVVNIIDTEASGQTTYRLAAACARRGHKVWLISAGNFSFDPDDRISAFAVAAPDKPTSSVDGFLDALKLKGRRKRWIAVDELDILLLRNNPARQTPWAQHAGIHFGRLAARRGVIVLNDPNGLSKAMNKLYLQRFPESVRPRTVITRNHSKIRRFVESEGTAVLKPLQGSGGQNVFLVRPNDLPNINQIIGAVSRDGYVIAQEYLEAAAQGDTRLFLMNGVPLQYKGHYAAFRRIRTGDDMRSNISAGGRLRRARLSDSDLQLAETVRPQLVKDGMFLVGLDIVGDRLMEINVFSPGGFGSAQTFEKVNFCDCVVDALEKKVQVMTSYRRNFENLDLATL